MKLNLLISSFIFLTLICSCATIRLEMRWLYTPYVGFIILISNMIAYIKLHIQKYFCTVIALSLLCIIIPTELYFRSYYKNIYYWKTYQIYNSVFDQTVARYKDKFWSKKLIIILKDMDFFGENAEALKTSLSMINPEKSVNIKVYGSVKDVSESCFKDDSNIILAVDNYTEKMINLKDINVEK